MDGPMTFDGSMQGFKKLYRQTTQENAQEMAVLVQGVAHLSVFSGRGPQGKVMITDSGATRRCWQEPGKRTW